MSGATREMSSLTERGRLNEKADCSGVRYLQWNSVTAGAWCAEFDGAHAVVNLTGRSVDCRYTAKNKRVILESRIKSTAVLGQCIRDCACPSKYWINAASATIYEDTRNENEMKKRNEKVSVQRNEKVSVQCFMILAASPIN
ncbi:MAG: NAD dependent epimerase/dehydratase family enzyme [Lentimonas sp.]|jgi:NAD dependent epimerase/dehydratase family enzyme